MPFEQNQQDGFNLGNSFDQVKRLTAEASNSAAAIAAAELAAEEEQQALRLKNLAIQQKLRIEQIKKQIELEEKSLLELEELRRACSERQYEARKREIQKELEAAKKAEEELFKTKNKHKKQQANASTQDTPATTASKSNAAQSKKSYTDGSGSGLAKVDLGISFKEVTDRFEAYIAANENVNASVQNAFDNIIKSDSSGTTLELAKDLLESVEEFEKETQKIQEFNNNRKHNIELIQSAEKHKLATQHAKAEHDNEIAASMAKARYEEFIAKKDLYAAEYRFAREKEFYDYQKQQAEELAKLESDIAWNSEHRNELLAQENQKAHKDYLREYLALQADEYSKLTENMSAAEFEKIRYETAQIKEAMEARGKATAAFDKAYAIQKGKGTAKEKKQLIDALVKERAAEKDWSNSNKKFQMTDDMSEEEKQATQKRRENAVKAEMAMNAAMNAMANLAQQLMNQADRVGEKQAVIDTRLQGSTVNDKNLGSYWKQLSRDMNKLGAVNPFFKQEDFANNIEALVNRGISFDIKQRAFLMTIQEKIANTFDVADGTLLRLIRIQQQDTTAGRLGMESALNSFLNSMYETSEYLTDVAASVRGSLEEMQALMEGAAGTELEFQVQKWMGSLYSVGMSQEAVQSIAQTFGQIASGDVSGLTGNGTGNLLIMAANEAGKSIADILQDGLDAKETNELMQAMVNYLAEIAETSSDSRVVQQQLANVYGMKASDLRAATNLASSIKEVSKQDLTYGGMIGQLEDMAKSMILRTSTGEMLSNVWGNVQYTMATQMSNDPVLYLLPKVATLLEDYAGGIDLPFLNVMGFGVDLNTSVAQLMNVAAMSGSILGALGPMMSGLANLSTSNLLRSAGIDTKNSKVPVIARGTVSSLQNIGGQGLSESGHVGNASGDDVKNATLQDAEDSKKKQMVEAKEEESSDDVVIRSQQAVIDIYNLLEEVAHGSQSLRVKVINANNGFGGGVVQNTIGGGDENSTGNPIHSGTDNGNWVFS